MAFRTHFIRPSTPEVRFLIIEMRRSIFRARRLYCFCLPWDRKYFICIIFPSVSCFISINALCWDIDFKRRIISEYVSNSSNSRRVNSINNYDGKLITSEGSATNTCYTIRNSYAGKLITSEGSVTNTRYTIRNSYAGKLIGFKGTLTDTRYSIRNSYTGKLIGFKGTLTDTRYSIRNSYAGKFIV